MICLLVYLAIGIVNWVAFVSRNGLDLEPHNNAIYLLNDGSSRTETRKDRVTVTVVEAVFFIVLWPAQVTFYIFTRLIPPVIDWIAGKVLP